MVIISPRIWREGRATDSKRTSVWSTKGCVEMRGEMGWLFLTPLIRQITQKESPPLSMWGVGGCSLSWSWKMMCLVQMSVGADHCQWSAKQHPDVGCFHMIGDQIHVVSQVLSNAKSSCYDNGNPPVSLIIFPLKPYISVCTPSITQESIIAQTISGTGRGGACAEGICTGNFVSGGMWVWLDITNLTGVYTIGFNGDLMLFQILASNCWLHSVYSRLKL